MLDVNKFKKINDTFGHVEGDAALIYCANALRDANRDSNNFIGRYGGDEYIIVSELDSEAEAELLCNKISLSLEKITKEANLPYSLTFSFGYALYNEKMKTIQSFIAAADKKLYEYKKNLNAD